MDFRINLILMLLTALFADCTNLIHKRGALTARVESKHSITPVDEIEQTAAIEVRENDVAAGIQSPNNISLPTPKVEARARDLNSAPTPVVKVRDIYNAADIHNLNNIPLPTPKAVAQAQDLDKKAKRSGRRGNGGGNGGSARANGGNGGSARANVGSARARDLNSAPTPVAKLP